MKKQKPTELFDFDQAPLPVGKAAPAIKKPFFDRAEQWLHIQIEKFRRKQDKRRRERERKRSAKKEAPTLSQLTQELSRARAGRRRLSALRNALLALAVLAVLIVCAAVYFPVTYVGGDSMSPALQSGDVVAAVRTRDVKAGDLVLFDGTHAQPWIKRVIALGGDEVNILPDGTVQVNGENLNEEYVQTLTRGDCDIEFPFIVPHGRVFVLGDQRALSVDSRHAVPGCIHEEQIIGRVVWRLFPFDRFGSTER